MTKEEILEYGRIHEEVYNSACAFASCWNEKDPNRWSVHNIDITKDSLRLTMIEYYCGDSDTDMVEIPLEIFVENTKWSAFIKEELQRRREEQERRQKKFSEERAKKQEEKERNEYERLKAKYERP